MGVERKEKGDMMTRIILALVLSIVLPLTSFAQDVGDILSEISLEDRRDLEKLFSEIMQFEHGSYALYGDKAIALSGDWIVTPLGNLFAGHFWGGIFWKRWETWRKYEKEFPMKNYLFIEEPSMNCENSVNLVFINKMNFIQTVNGHLRIFRERLGSDLTGENLLSEIENKCEFVSIIKNDEMLWGILLGYGPHNAKLYDQRNKLEGLISCYESIIKPESIVTSKLASIKEECDHVNAKLKGFGDHNYSPLFSCSMHFVADLEHPETKVLKNKYSRIREKISDIYAKGNFLETVLKQLTSY